MECVGNARAEGKRWASLTRTGTMTGSILLDVHVTETQTFKAALDRVSMDSPIERRARVLAGLVDGAVRLPAGARQAWHDFLEDVAEAGGVLVGAAAEFRRVLDAFTQSHVF